MVKSECSICNSSFDDGHHRPRALPCGHGFCTQCIETCIRNGSKSCPVCRTEHGAHSATELPVSFLLEELLDNAEITDIQEYDFDKFHEEKKQYQISNVQRQKQVFIDTENNLKELLEKNIIYVTEKNNKKQELEKEVKLLQTKIECINKKIIEEKESQEKIKDVINGCQKHQKSFETIENKLKAATKNQDIANEYESATAQILQSQKWEETVMKELNVKKVRYAIVKRYGVLRSSRALKDGGRTFIPSLSKEVIPSITAELIKESMLGLTSASTTVFMDLTAQGHDLGRVFIRVIGDRNHGKQFITLALGTDGPTFKGATFNGKSDNFIELSEYVKEDGSQSGKPLLTTLKREHNEAPLRGRLFPWAVWGVNTASFGIMTGSWENLKFPGYFGYIIDGMEVIDRTLSHEYKATDISINECGIVLDY